MNSLQTQRFNQQRKGEGMLATAWVIKMIVTQGRDWLQEWGKEAEPLNQGDDAHCHRRIRKR